MRKALAFVVASGLTVSGCANLTPQQRENLQLQVTLAKQIGTDAVQIWCASSGIIYVVANNIDAKSRVSAALGKNSAAATAACPMIAAITGITIVTSAEAAKL